MINTHARVHSGSSIPANEKKSPKVLRVETGQRHVKSLLYQSDVAPAW